MFPMGEGGGGDPAAPVQKQQTAMPQRRRMMGAGPLGSGQMRPRPQMGQMGQRMPGMGAPQGLGGQVPKMPMMQRPPGGEMLQQAGPYQQRQPPPGFNPQQGPTMDPSRWNMPDAGMGQMGGMAGPGMMDARNALALRKQQFQSAMPDFGMMER